MTVYVRLDTEKFWEIKNAHSWRFYVLILAALLLLIPITLIGFIFFVRAPREIRCAHLSLVRQNIQPGIEEIKKFKTNFDFLVFTQLYPVSSCIVYKQESPSNQCNFPDDKQAWSIHGIWPSIDNIIGPAYCKTEYFNASALESIRSELNMRWASIKENGNENFWKHEWLKHGSCAEQLPAFDTELKYFSQGLAWNEQYNITQMLESAGIVPNNSRPLKIDDFHDAVLAHTGLKPNVACVWDKVKNVSIINEIRLCFDKENTLESCENIEEEDECPLEGIIYPEASFVKSLL